MKAERDPTKPGRRGRWWLPLLVLLAAVAAVVGVVAAVAWSYSSDIVVPDHSGGEYGIEVTEVSGSTVTLQAESSVDRRGVYGLEWEGGHAVVGGVVAGGEGSVTRRIGRVRGDLEPGEMARFDPDAFRGDPRAARGLDYQAVEVEGELGPMPAWQIGEGGRRWAIVVHGINGHRRAGLRIAPALREAGLTSLLISYRNDEDAPPSPDGKHHMGLTEWRDLEAAARYAVQQGARELVLVGYSMGGSIAVQFMAQSPLARGVSAMVLDSPALDWPGIMAYGARQRGLPEIAHLPVKWTVGLRIDADWEQLDALEQAGSLQVPILLFHGTVDDLVPIGASHALARELPDLVELEPVYGAFHVQAWNHDPAAYEQRVERFLTGALGRFAAGRGAGSGGSRGGGPASGELAARQRDPL